MDKEKFIDFAVLFFKGGARYFRKEGNFILMECYIMGKLVNQERIHFVSFIFQHVTGVTEQEKSQIIRELLLS